MDRFANKKYFFARLTNGTASENGHATSGETNERLIQLENQNEALRRCLNYSFIVAIIVSIILSVMA